MVSAVVAHGTNCDRESKKERPREINRPSPDLWLVGWLVGWDQVRRRGTSERSTTDCVIDRLDVEFKRADDGSLLDVAEVLVGVVRHLAIHSFQSGAG